MPKTDRQKGHNSRGRFEQWVRNPGCEANIISSVHGLTMDKVAAQDGLRTTRGQSPFAIARGKQFERSLFRENAARLVEELQKFGEIQSEVRVEFLDFRQRPDGGPCKNIEESMESAKFPPTGATQFP